MAGYQVESSDVCGHPSNCRWPAPLAQALAGRRQSAGADKGRILYAFEVPWRSQDRSKAVGALTYHLDDRQIQITHIGVVSEKAMLATPIMTILINCALEIARMHRCNRLEWSSNDQSLLRIAPSLGFHRARANDRSQKKLRGRTLVLRDL